MPDEEVIDVTPSAAISILLPSGYRSSSYGTIGDREPKVSWNSILMTLVVVVWHAAARPSEKVTATVPKPEMASRAAFTSVSVALPAKVELTWPPK